MNVLLTASILPTGQSLQLVRGDITDETTEAIVNAANANLKHGAGVAGAILKRGGRIIQEEFDAWVRQHGPVSHAEPAWTSGGELACRVVIHAVGPIWDDNNPPALVDAGLSAAVRGCLRLTDRLGLTSIAFPAISTGIFGFPKERAAELMIKSILDYFRMASGINSVRLVVLDPTTITAFEKIWHDHFEPKHQT